MLVKKIPHAHTHQFPPLVLDYLQGAETLRPFCAGFPSLAAYGPLMEARIFSATSRAVLAQEMQRQYRTLNLLTDVADEPVKQNLQKLAQPDTFTVTTGHQLNIFTGPLYTIYKVLSVINLAEQLNRHYPGKHIVPVFWMATEDHDFAEINHFNLFGKNREWAYPETEQGKPVGRLSTQGLPEMVAELEQLNLPADLLTIFKNGYSGFANLADATQYIYHQLFRNHGLIVLQPDQPILKQQFEKYIATDVLKKKNEADVKNSVRSLQELGYKTQVNPRPINHFYFAKSAKRERIVFDNNYHVLNTPLEFDAEQMQNEINSHPELFSPNVVMRPLYQEVILPNLGYVGGPGEVAYWLELKSMFDANLVQFPMLHLRNSFVLLGGKAWKQLEQSKLEPEDFFLEAHEMTDKFLERNASNARIENEISEIYALLDQIPARVETVDKSKVGAWVRRINDEKALIKKLSRDFVDIVKQSQESQIDKMLKIKSTLLPGDEMAERVENLFSKAQNGHSAFIQFIYQYTDIFDTNISCLKI